MCCPLPLVLGQHYKTQARSKCQQLIQVFRFDLSWDSNNSSKVMGKWHKMPLEVCPLWLMSYDLPPPDTLNLQQCLCTWSHFLGLGWNWPVLCHKGVLGRANQGRKQFLHNGTQILLAGECPVRSLWNWVWWLVGHDSSDGVGGEGTVQVLLQRQCLFVPTFLKGLWRE